MMTSFSLRLFVFLSLSCTCYFTASPPPSVDAVIIKPTDLTQLLQEWVVVDEFPIVVLGDEGGERIVASIKHELPYRQVIQLTLKEFVAATNHNHRVTEFKERMHWGPNHMLLQRGFDVVGLSALADSIVRSYVREQFNGPPPVKRMLTVNNATWSMPSLFTSSSLLPLPAEHMKAAIAWRNALLSFDRLIEQPAGDHAKDCAKFGITLTKFDHEIIENDNTMHQDHDLQLPRRRQLWKIKEETPKHMDVIAGLVEYALEDDATLAEDLQQLFSDPNDATTSSSATDEVVELMSLIISEIEPESEPELADDDGTICATVAESRCLETLERFRRVTSRTRRRPSIVVLEEAPPSASIATAMKEVACEAGKEICAVLAHEFLSYFW